MRMAEDPTAVRVVLDDRTIPEEKVQGWRETWAEASETTREMYDSDEQQFLDSQAFDWVSRQFSKAGRDELHYWIDHMEAIYDDD